MAANVGVEQVLTVLRNASTPLKALDIAKKMGLKRCSDVNPLLYELEEKGLVSVAGQPPMWTITETTSDLCVNQSIPRQSTMEQALTVLRNASTPLKALDIAKKIGLTRCSDVNPVLYELKDKGSVSVAGEPPMWKINETGEASALSPELNHASSYMSSDLGNGEMTSPILALNKSLASMSLSQTHHHQSPSNSSKSMLEHTPQDGGSMSKAVTSKETLCTRDNTPLSSSPSGPCDGSNESTPPTTGGQLLANGQPSVKLLTCFPSVVGGERKVINIIQKTATSYAQLGMFLLDDDNGDIVDSLKEACHHDPVQITTAVYKKWISGTGRKPVTWETLVSVLREVDLNRVADNIESIVKPSK